MKLTILARLCFVLFVFANLSCAGRALAQSTQKVSIDRLKADVKFLSSDAMKGRDVFSEEIKKAADYIAESFKKAGLETDAVDGGPFQFFEMSSGMELGGKSDNWFKLTVGEDQKLLKLGEDFSVLGNSGSGSAQSPVVFAGYGITTGESEDYDDYKDIDVTGKVVLILRREPQQGDAKSVFDGTQNSTHALFTSKVANAQKRGAAALIIVNDAYSIRNSLRASRNTLKRYVESIAKTREEFAKKPNPTLSELKSFAESIEDLTQKINRTTARFKNFRDTLVPFGASRGNSNKKMPVLFAKRATFEKAIKATYEGKSLEDLELEIDKTLKPVSKELKGIKIACATKIARKVAKAKNVIGVLPGKGDLADEIVIVGAHYDHVGMGGFGSLAPWTNEIHNGADDNASGTSGLLEIARLIAKIDAKSHRKIVLMTFSAEERGLIGSKYYCNNPVFSLDQTVAMVNLDMIGRMSNNKLTVYGTGTSAGFDKLVDDLNQNFKFNLSKIRTGFGPSDHESFYRKKIPVFHMFTGLHSDYHRPVDDFDKVNYEGMEKVTQMTYEIVRHLAVTDQKPEYIQVRRSRAPTGPWIGISADTEREVEGFAIDTVSTGGPAAKAGLKSGDVINKINDDDIKSSNDIRRILQKYKPNDKIKLQVVRDGKEQVIELTLGAR